MQSLTVSGARTEQLTRCTPRGEEVDSGPPATTAFDEQTRRHPAAEAPGERVERDEAVVRFVGGEGGRSAVTWSELTEQTADAVIAATIDRFALLGGDEWEWKHYSYDRPPTCSGA